MFCLGTSLIQSSTRAHAAFSLNYVGVRQDLANASNQSPFIDHILPWISSQRPARPDSALETTSCSRHYRFLVNAPMNLHGALQDDSEESLLKAKFVGQTLQHVETPAAVLDRAVVERNCSKMLEACRALGVGFRPHVKTHKVWKHQCILLSLLKTALNLGAIVLAILLCELLLIIKCNSCSSYSLSLPTSSELFCAFSSGIRCRIGWAHNCLGHVHTFHVDCQYICRCKYCPTPLYAIIAVATYPTECSLGRCLNSLGVRRVSLMLRKAMNRKGVVLMKAYLVIA